MDTIFALATAQGRAGVAVIRISGDCAADACVALMGTMPTDRGLRFIRNTDGEILDQALVLTFPKGHSFTGELVVELHLHGSIAIVNAVLARLAVIPGLRAAEAGEFTQRALENGRLDLTQVEGLADLIDAETESQRRQAMRVFAGGLGALADNWRKDLIRAAALLEATIDFVDEDVPVDVYPEVCDLLNSVSKGIAVQISGYHAAERIRTGFEVAIIGPPNAGKSTLLNRLAGRDAAITSEIAGTTRDVIEVQMDVRGLPVTLLDTAGLRDTIDPIEEIGVARAVERAGKADLRVFLGAPTDSYGLELDDRDIVLVPKQDTFDAAHPGISGKTGAGVDMLIDRIFETLSALTQNAGLAIRDRHRKALVDAKAQLAFVLEHLDGGTPVDLLAEDLRAAIRCIDMIVGRVDVEDLLGEIFASFCIGK